MSESVLDAIRQAIDLQQKREPDNVVLATPSAIARMVEAMQEEGAYAPEAKYGLRIIGAIKGCPVHVVSEATIRLINRGEPKDALVLPRKAWEIMTGAFDSKSPSPSMQPSASPKTSGQPS